MRRAFRGLLLALCVGTHGGCARFSTTQGVAARWQDADAPVFETGHTTQSDVLQALGPPSQVISLHDGTVFYYLREIGTGKALVLLVYNNVQRDISYDRAVLFFDREGILTDQAFSHEPDR
jgi:hypothetical protein